MLLELGVAGVMVILTVLIHGLGLALLGRLLHAEEQEERSQKLSLISPRGTLFTIGMVLGVLILHAVEIWLYAALYHGLGAVPDIRNAVYFSTITYGAIGYSDAAIDEQWRLLAGIEGINGVLLIGWSTAFVVTLMARLRLVGGTR